MAGSGTQAKNGRRGTRKKQTAKNPKVVILDQENDEQDSARSSQSGFDKLLVALSSAKTELGVGDEIKKELEWVLKRRGVNTSRLVEKVPTVFAQALQTLSITSARAEAIRLMGACLDNRTSHRVLPAHVEVLKQLSEDEFAILRQISTTSRGTPMGLGMLVTPREAPIPLYKNIILESAAALVEHRENIPQYIENMERLGLVMVTQESCAPEGVYRDFTRYKFLQDTLADTPRGSRIAITPLCIQMTDFGRGLTAICSL